MKNELFEFDLIGQIRKDMPELLMEEEGLTEEQAKVEVEKMINESEKISNWAKKELENIKCDFEYDYYVDIPKKETKIIQCDFAGKIANSKSIDDEINKHLVIKKHR